MSGHDRTQKYPARPPDPAPEFWPPGCRVDYVAACNCAYCGELLDALERWRDGQAADGQHRSIESFAGGVAADD